MGELVLGEIFMRGIEWFIFMQMHNSKFSILRFLARAESTCTCVCVCGILDLSVSIFFSGWVGEFHIFVSSSRPLMFLLVGCVGGSINKDNFSANIFFQANAHFHKVLIFYQAVIYIFLLGAYRRSTRLNSGSFAALAARFHLFFLYMQDRPTIICPL